MGGEPCIRGMRVTAGTILPGFARSSDSIGPRSTGDRVSGDFGACLFILAFRSLWSRLGCGVRFPGTDADPKSGTWASREARGPAPPYSYGQKKPYGVKAQPCKMFEYSG